MVLEGLTAMRGPNDAIALLSVHGKVSGVYEIRWRCKSGIKTTLEYHPYPRKVDMNNGRELLLNMWQMLDATVNEIHDELTPLQEYNKGRARALCEVIHSLMPQFYESADDVVREALARFKDRINFIEHETPGLGEKYWDPNARWDGTPYGVKSTTTVTKKKASGNLIPPPAVVSVKNGITSGMFTVEQIANMYNMHSHEVKEQLGLA